MRCDNKNDFNRFAKNLAYECHAFVKYEIAANLSERAGKICEYMDQSEIRVRWKKDEMAVEVVTC